MCDRFLGGGFFPVAPHQWAALKKLILNKVKESFESNVYIIFGCKWPVDLSLILLWYCFDIAFPPATPVGSLICSIKICESTISKNLKMPVVFEYFIKVKLKSPISILNFCQSESYFKDLVHEMIPFLAPLGWQNIIWIFSNFRVLTF